MPEPSARGQRHQIWTVVQSDLVPPLFFMEALVLIVCCVAVYLFCGFVFCFLTLSYLHCRLVSLESLLSMSLPFCFAAWAVTVFLEGRVCSSGSCHPIVNLSFLF